MGYALDVPWYASLPRIETRFYIEQYGGENDIWIGKTLYRYLPFPTFSLNISISILFIFIILYSITLFIKRYHLFNYCVPYLYLTLSLTLWMTIFLLYIYIYIINHSVSKHRVVTHLIFFSIFLIFTLSLHLYNIQ